MAARDDIARTLGDAPPGQAIAEESELAPGLHHISIDPQAAMRMYLEDQLPSRALAGLLGSSTTFELLVAATPGLRELLTVGKVWELAQSDRRTPGARPYDLVILDAPATGHGVAILQAPRTFAAAARVGPIARQGRTIDAMLSDPSRTGVALVTTAEETPVNETLALRETLRGTCGLPADLVVVNRMLPDRFRRADVSAIGAASSPLAARAVRTADARASAQRAQIARLRRAVTDVPVRTLPFSFAPMLDSGELGALARRLERVLA